MLVECFIFVQTLFKNPISLDWLLNSVDLYVGSSTDISQAVHCDRTDHRHYYTQTITLWCLEPTYGRYVFIKRDVASIPNTMRVMELAVY